MNRKYVLLQQNCFFIKNNKKIMQSKELFYNNVSYNILGYHQCFSGIGDLGRIYDVQVIV